MIRIENVTKMFANGDPNACVTALENVSFDVAENEFVCVLGPSGCGKSTLLNLIAGFTFPSSGSVVFKGKPVTGPGPDRGVVFQDPTLFPWLSARRNVEFGLLNKGVPKKLRRERAEESLALVGLNGFRDSYPHELSGGMRQRVALARVLALEPDALLMDEPFSALDADTRERLQDELLRIWERRRKTVVFVTHNVDEAAYLGDRVLVLGPPPDNAREAISITLDRPRDRNSAEPARITERLRAELRNLPCRAPSKR